MKTLLLIMLVAVSAAVGQTPEEVYVGVQQRVVGLTYESQMVAPVEAVLASGRPTDELTPRSFIRAFRMPPLMPVEERNWDIFFAGQTSQQWVELRQYIEASTDQHKLYAVGRHYIGCQLSVVAVPCVDSYRLTYYMVGLVDGRVVGARVEAQEDAGTK